MYDIEWTDCRDRQPPASSAETYIVTIYSPETQSITVGLGKYTAAGEYPDDTDPKDAWLVCSDNAIGADMEELCNLSEWEPPEFYHAFVVAWALFPKPYTGSKQEPET